MVIAVVVFELIVCLELRCTKLVFRDGCKVPEQAKAKAPCFSLNLSRHSRPGMTRGIIRERVNAGLARAKAKGTKLGRRPVKPSTEARIRELKASGMGILKIGRTLKVGTSVVQRVLSAPV
jgi:hypothetical protein